MSDRNCGTPGAAAGASCGVRGQRAEVIATLLGQVHPRFPKTTVLLVGCTSFLLRPAVVVPPLAVGAVTVWFFIAAVFSFGALGPGRVFAGALKEGVERW